MIGELNKFKLSKMIKKIKKEKKNIFEREFKTFIFTILLFIFILGFYSGWYFADKSLQDFEVEYSQTQLNLDSLSQRFKFMNNFNSSNICDEKKFSEGLLTLYNSGIELEDLEKEDKIGTEYYNFLKEKHNLNQVLFYSEYKKYYDKCNTSSNIILFFFNKNSPEISEKQGNELDKVVEKFPNTKVIAMDYNYTEKLNYFYEYYDIDLLPSIIINYNTKIIGFVNASDVEIYLNKAE